MTKIVDRCGKRYGKLVVVKRVGSDHRGKSLWECMCDCGGIKTANSSDLHKGNILSCGCLQKEHRLKGFNKTHGLTKTSEYNTWVGMKARCYNGDNPAYHNYGGRGIAICDRWRDSFENFIQDMGNRPSPKHSIDRIDTNGNYEPDNCRWATDKEQMNNVRYNRLITIDGVTKTVSEFADFYGIKLSVAQCRLARGWSNEEAFKAELTPINRFITVGGVTQTVTEMARIYNIDRRLVTNRLRRNWTPEQAVKTPPGQKPVSYII